jgi:Tfp pilus assembly protein PilV
MNDRSGFSLLSVLVAIVLFAVAFLAAGRSIAQSVHQVGLSETYAQAREFAIEEMERIRLLPYEDIASLATAPIPEAPRYLRSVDVAIVGSDPEELYAYRLITVTVQPPAELPPVRISSAVAE